MDDKVNSEDLQRIEVFRNVELGQLQAHLDRVRKITLHSDEILLSPGENNQEIYALLEGELLICLQARDLHAIAKIQPGECVGEISIIDDQPPSAYVRTSGECTLLAIHRDVLTDMFECQPNLAVNLLKLLGERFRQNNDILLHSFELQQEYRNKAERDALTGLHNRSWMMEVFPRQLDLSERVGQKVTMMMIDVDHFKQVNDTYGHRSGDRVLQLLAEAIQTNLRETDLLVRYGGEELLVLMPGTTASKAHVIAERIRSIVYATPISLEDSSVVNLTISIGMSEWRAGESVNSLIDRADKALYQSKDGGRNQVSIC